MGAPGPGTPSACTISVIDAANDIVIKTITTGDEPMAYCYSPASEKVYWINEWSHNVVVADAATDSIIKIIPLGNPPVQPVDICYNPVNERVYTANRLTYNISVIRDTLGTSDLPNITDTDLSPLIYPNPAGEVLFIKNIPPNTDYFLFNTSGQLVLMGKTDGSIVLSNLRQGIYYLKLGEARKQKSMKLIKTN